MPCIKCSNGKYKYGVHGNCQFDTLAKCEDAAAAIHINNPNSKDSSMDNKKPKKKPPLSTIKPQPGPHGPIPDAPVTASAKDVMPTAPMNPNHDPSCQCPVCMKDAMTPWRY
jgi:hypothetical protein